MSRRQNGNFLTLKGYCPICGGKDCPVRIGYYYRYYVDIKIGKIILIPIVRYICRRKGKANLKDKTFSLLPYFLIPYHRFTIDSAMQVIGKKLIQGKTNKKIADEISYAFDPDTLFNFEERYVNYWIQFFRQTVLKLIAFLSSFNQDTSFLKGSDSMYNAWVYLDRFVNDSDGYAGATGFCQYFYEKQGGYRENPQFLFGTAYQFL